MGVKTYTYACTRTHTHATHMVSLATLYPQRKKLLASGCGVSMTPSTVQFLLVTWSYTSFLTIIPSSFPLSWSGSVWACSLDSHQHYVAVWLKQELYRYCLCTCPLMCFYQFTRLLSLTASEIKNTKVSVQSLNTTTATPAGNPVHCTLTWWHVTDCSQVLKSLNNM